jgi:hypothetical protein
VSNEVYIVQVFIRGTWRDTQSYVGKRKFAYDMCSYMEYHRGYVARILTLVEQET